MNLGNIFQALTQGVKKPDTPVGTSGTMSAGERNYRALIENRNMAPGQTVQGEVIGKEGNTVQIALDAETVLSAKLERDLNIALGQSMTFEVKANNGSFLSLTPLYANMANEATILRALSAAGLSASIDNMKMVSAMMQEGMSIDKDSIAYVNRQFIDFPNAGTDSILQMIRLEMPITEANIEQFEMYKNYEHQILQSAADIMEELPHTYMELISEGKENEALLFYEQIIKAFVGDEAKEGMAQAVLPNNAGEEAQAAGEAAMQGAAEGLTDGVNAMEALQNGGKNASVDENADTHQNSGINEALSKAAENALKTGIPEGENVNVAGEAAKNAEAGGVLEGQNTDKSHISQKTWQELSNMLQKLGADAETVKYIAQGDASPKEALSQINNLIEANTPMFKESFHEALKELFGSRAFQNLLQSEMSNNWLLKPEEVAYKENVEQLYERIKEQTARMNEAFQMSGKADSAGARSVQNLQNNVDFMNQMNHLFPYVQLPLKMMGNQAHGDLYVYTNKKSLAKKDGNVSALLHLDMENLGPMDVYVTMNIAQNKVNTSFTLKDEASMDLIAENIHILNERLEKRGYSMKADFKLKNEDEPDETNIMDEIIKQSKNISVLSRTSFDMRA